jgi:hypothetical protein
MNIDIGGGMSTAQNGTPATVAVGGVTSGEEGSTPTHETMAETGGSGGTQQTKPKNEETARATGAVPPADAMSTPPIPEGAGSAATAIGRGFQDTRSSQAGPGATGLGTPETGGNQSEADLAPPRKP